MTKSRAFLRVTITDLSTGTKRFVEPTTADELAFNRRYASAERQMGLSVGAIGSGSTIELSALPEGVRLGIMFISIHVLLVGECPPEKVGLLPMFGVGGYPGHPSRNHAFGVYTRREGEDPGTPGEAWNELDLPDDCLDQNGDFYLRFDSRPIRIGDEVIELEYVEA